MFEEWLCFALCKPECMETNDIICKKVCRSCQSFGEAFLVGFFHNTMFCYAKSRQDSFLPRSGIYVKIVIPAWFEKGMGAWMRICQNRMKT